MNACSSFVLGHSGASFEASRQAASDPNSDDRRTAPPSGACLRPPLRPASHNLRVDSEARRAAIGVGFGVVGVGVLGYAVWRLLDRAPAGDVALLRLLAPGYVGVALQGAL